MNSAEFKALFLSQSYIDAWNEYKRSLTSRKAVLWDYVVLTASNESQAEIYRAEIASRLGSGFLPKKTEYFVVSDPDGKRVGSGGATLNVMKELALKDSEFANKRILIIHSGGDSKRVPQYSICGKLFSPVPRELPDGRASTLFDEFIITMSAMAGRISEGMLVLSGDVLFLFNPLQIDAQLSGAAAISIKCDVETGSHHGVFLSNGEGQVARFLHKQTVESLKHNGAVDERGNIDIDTGAVLMDSDLVKALYSLVCTDGKLDELKFNQFVSEESRVSFYGDFLYPLAKESTFEQYLKEAAEGEINDALLACRTEIWDAIHGFTFKLFSLSPAEFLHFGTSKELLELVTKGVSSYSLLGWEKQVHSFCPDTSASVYYSVVDAGAVVPADSYIEYSHVHSGVKVGHNSIVSGVELFSGDIPDNTVIHGVVQKDGQVVVRTYGISDNPKDEIELNGKKVTLWDAPLYGKADDAQEALEKRGEMSLHSSFEGANGLALLEFRKKLEDRILLAKIKKAISLGESEKTILSFFDKVNLSERLMTYLIESAKESEFSDKIRIYHLLSSLMDVKNVEIGDVDSEIMADACYQEIGKAILGESLKNIPEGNKFSFVKEESTIDLPVRVNWGGGWTDTPPQCMEMGGIVINAAISLNGQKPIHAITRKTKEKGIFFESSDLGVKGKATSIEDIRDCRNPGDFFALHKAALLATGVIPMEGNTTLEEICDRLGGGLYICTSVDDIPKGSGLGTSSILAAASVKAIFDIFGVELPGDEIYGVVLAMEQLMSTGGGWQDQVGGLCPGIKRVTSRAGLDQRIHVEPLVISETTKIELQERFALIYTGQRRLARNLLRDVIGSYIEGKKDTVDALYEMKIISEKMQTALENDKVDKLAELFNEHWEVSKKLDGGCTNTCIDSIFDSCEDLIAGRFIAGAGGGGFLQVILKKGVTKEQLSDRLFEIFGDSGVAVWNPEFVW